MLFYCPEAQELVIDTRAASRRGDLMRPWPRPWAALFSDPVNELATTDQVYCTESAAGAAAARAAPPPTPGTWTEIDGIGVTP